MRLSQFTGYMNEIPSVLAILNGGKPPEATENEMTDEEIFSQLGLEMPNG